MFLKAVMIATCLVAAPDSEARDGTQMLVEALVEVQNIEHRQIFRCPPRYVLTWIGDNAWQSELDSISADEYEARFSELQPVIANLMQATAADPSPFSVMMLPEGERNYVFGQTRRDAVRLLLGDAERLAMSEEATEAVDRMIAVLRLIAVNLRSSEGGGFVEENGDLRLGHVLAASDARAARQTLCIIVPELPEGERARLAKAVESLAADREATAETLGHWYATRLTAEFTRDGVLSEAAAASLEALKAAAETTNDPSSLLHQYTHLLVAVETSSGDGVLSKHAARYRRTLHVWLQLTDDIAGMRGVLSGHPTIEIPLLGDEFTNLSSIHSALRLSTESANAGNMEATIRAAACAMMLRDWVAMSEPIAVADESRSAMLSDLRNLRADDPLRFESNSIKAAERMFLDMQTQIETTWRTRELFLEFAPEWFAKRYVPDAARGVQQVATAIGADEDFQQRLLDYSRGWLAAESNPRDTEREVLKLRYPASESVENWDPAESAPRRLTLYGPMAAYLSRDWSDTLRLVRLGTRALWELRDLLEAD